ncbi:MAG: disulfide bond formation protein B [Azonexus sp.]|nr:disulfide bond formation protein B [Azonexus sp.]MDZ4314202.1 disulfide bond formation protein B [Azonexus sp.]
MIRISPRLLWMALALGSAGLVAGSFGLTALLKLHPCHLCIFQRLLFMILALLGAVAAWQVAQPAGRWAGMLSLPVSAVGIAVATYQSWLQAQPTGTVSCSAGQPGLIEQIVEWLGGRLPQLFMATGFCEEAELWILGLSLANWALVSFTASFAVAIWAFLRLRRRD